jgi:hypothetical protein
MGTTGRRFFLHGRQRAKSAPVNSSGLIRAPGCHSESISETERWPTVGTDGREAGLKPNDKTVYVS